MRNKIHKAIDWLFNKAMYISSIALVGLAIVDISDLNKWKCTVLEIQNVPVCRIIYIACVILAIIFGLFSIANAKNIEALELDKVDKGNKIIDLESSLSEVVFETNELFNSYLKLLVKNLDFTHKERISVYKTYESNFVLIGRSSVNPNFMQPGRSNYPISEGFIGKGWAEGEYFINNLPDPTVRSGNPYYKAVNDIAEIPRATVAQIKMKSRTYFAYRINGYDGDPKAVLVFESETDSAFTKDEVIEKLKGVKQPLVMFIEKNNGVKVLESNSLGL